MKRFMDKKVIFGIFIGITIASVIGVSAVMLSAREISFTPKDNSFVKENGEVVDNVEDAINELYNSNKKCVKGTFLHEANTQYNFDLGFQPSIFLASGNNQSAKIIIFFSADFDSTVRYVASKDKTTTSTNYNIIFQDGHILSNMLTSYSSYKNEYTITYVACK